MLNILTFTINNAKYGFNILQVKEVNDNLNYSVVPTSDKRIRGLLNIRGQIITIFDLKMILGLGEAFFSKTTKNIILKSESETENLVKEYQIKLSSNDVIGFMVDKVNDVIELEKVRIQPPPANNTKKYIQGIVQFDNELLTILNVNEMALNNI